MTNKHNWDLENLGGRFIFPVMLLLHSPPLELPHSYESSSYFVIKRYHVETWSFFCSLLKRSSCLYLLLPVPVLILQA